MQLGKVPTGLADFEGEWRLHRQIRDAAHSQHATFTGQATLIPAPDGGLDYHETGTMELLGGQRLHAERRYHWAISGALVHVSFDDGRPFHSFVLRAQSDGSDHLCGADMYRVTYNFTQWPIWVATWRVQGPRKSYVSQTQFRPKG